MLFDVAIQWMLLTKKVMFVSLSLFPPIKVPSGADPRGVSWEISGGEPARPGDELSGEGLEGTLFAVGGGRQPIVML